MKQMSDYFRQFRIFNKLRAGALERIQYYMVLKTFTLGQTLFKEGLSRVDGIYFIKSGDFEITISAHHAETEKTTENHL